MDNEETYEHNPLVEVLWLVVNAVGGTVRIPALDLVKFDPPRSTITITHDKFNDCFTIVTNKEDIGAAL
jgi:hypothetical protein